MKFYKYILLFFIYNSVIAQNQPKTAQDYIKEAQKSVDLGNDSVAIVYYKKADNIYKKQQQYNLSAEVCYWIAARMSDNYRYEESIKQAKSVIQSSTFLQVADTTKIRLYGQLYLVYRMKGQLDSSAFWGNHVEQLLKTKPKLHNHPALFTYYRTTSYYANAVGNFAKAENYAQLLLKCSAKLEESDKFPVYNLLGLIAKNQRKYKEAIYYFEKAIETTSSPSFKAYYYRLIILSNHEQKRFRGIEKYFDLARQNRNLQVKLNNGQSDYILDYYLISSEALQAQFEKKFEKAEKLFKNAIKITETDLNNTKPAFRVKTYVDLSNLEIERGDLKKSLKYAQLALKSSHVSFNSDNIRDNPKPEGAYFQNYLFLALVQKAKVLDLMSPKDRNLTDLALKTYIYAFDSADFLRKTYEEDDSKQILQDELYPSFLKALERCYERWSYSKDKYYLDIYLKILQQNQANRLKDALRDFEIKPNFISKDDLSKEQKISAELNDLQIKRANTSIQTTKDSINGLIVERILEKDILQKEIANKAPQYYAAKFKNNYLETSQVQKKVVDNNTALISYTLSEKSLYIFLITNSKSDIYRLPTDTNFVTKLKQYRNLLANSPQGKKYDGQALSAELYNILIQPIEKEIADKKRLIIIRDAELNYIPFEVLAKQKGDFLLKKHTISYTYSASLLNSPVATFAQPLPNREGLSKKSLLGFAPFSNNSFQQSLFRDKNLGQLPKSADEVQKIGGDIYLEDEATKKRFYETYRGKNIIHFATHAITDDTDPLKSFIAFYPDGTDYKLFTNELYDLELQNTNLVMLSACETGVGKLQKGEGVMSLSRAFTYAGAKAVITTLWNAHDEASAYISERFYKHLKDGLKTDEALRQAKLDFLNSELSLRYEHPYYWANFILIGPAETISFGMNWWVWGSW
ncbi:MAG: CHAT domain-containing protein [Spirosomaceae bacterium]|nr:CHAT domain-containing protein [Spirosomataceae bacterium]